MILLLLITGTGPCAMWQDALPEASWADECAQGLRGNQAAVSYSGVLPDPLLRFSVAGSPSLEALTFNAHCQSHS